MNSKLLFAGVAGVALLPLWHPFGPVRHASGAATVAGLPASMRPCQSCHSESTQWPWYGYLPGASWMLEKDVADAREHMNLSRWAGYSQDRQLELLGRIAGEVRNARMPPARYTLMHPEARLSAAQRQEIIDWVKRQRREIRSSGINSGFAESFVMTK